MKKARYIIIAIMILLIGLSIFIGVSIKNSPEYALMQIAGDIKESGINGLTPYLTKDAQKVVDAVSAVTENKLISSIIGLFGQSEYAGILKSEIQEIQWDIEDILKSSKHASVILAFNYDDKLIGTIELSMVREDSGWKIDGLELPKFDEINWE